MIHEAYLTRELKRWLKPDSSRWVRPDAMRFLIPGTDPADVFPELARKYSPSQPRVPGGSGRESGRWTDGSATSGEGRPRVIIDTTDLDNGGDPDGEDIGIQLAQIGSGVTDADGFPYYDRFGHHELPRGVYEKWDLQPETREVFDRSTTGRLPPGTTVLGPDGPVPGHYWNEAHRGYNDAVRELGERFMDERGLNPKTMTAEDAKALLRDIRTSDDPRISDFNRGIRMLRRIWRSFGRGRE